MLYEYDASNEKCPLPLVKMRVILKKMQLGDSCMIRIVDKGSKENIPHYLKKTAVEYELQELENKTLEIIIKK
jgi:TusA-related sulfurtransferase